MKVSESIPAGFTKNTFPRQAVNERTARDARRAQMFFAPISLVRGFINQQITTMKRWAILTVFLYALALLLLTIPVALLAFANWGKTEMNIGFNEILKYYSNWGYWLWLGILVAGQALLLLLPINLAERRLPARRPLKIPIIVTAFFLANLCFAGLFSLLCAIFTDGTFEYYNLAKLFQSAASQSNDSGNGTLFTMIFTVLVFWAVWALVFFRPFQVRWS